MIVNFNIENFGSVKEKQTLSFEASNSDHLEDHYVLPPVGGQRLLKMALIYGANASGKTTILKALDFLRDLVLSPLEKKTDSLDFNPFLFDKKTPNESTILSIEFIQNEVKYFYEVEFNKNAVVNEELNFYNPNKANVFKRTTNLDHQFSEITFGNKIKKDRGFKKSLESNTIWNNTVLGGYLKTNIDIHELKEVTDWFNDYLDSLIFTKTKLERFVINKIEKTDIKKSDVVSILKKADFNISDISVGEPEEMSEEVENLFKAMNFDDETIEKFKKNPPKKIQFEHTIGSEQYYLPISQESEGTKRYFEFAGLLCLLIKKQIAMPIDELESSLHPELYLHFLLSFITNSKNSQLIATTHNREILDNKDIFRDDCVWITDKEDSCSTSLYSLAHFDSSVIRDTTNRLNAYKSGKLGGVPNLGDYFIDITE